MLLGLEEGEKQFKNDMQAGGADMAVVKSWLRTYTRTRRSAVNVATRYYGEKENLEYLLERLQRLEKMIIGYNNLEGDDKKEFLGIIRDFKKVQGNFDDEFLISDADNDFHTTLDSVIRLGPKYADSNDGGIILQSEVENLIELTKEGLERQHPDLFALAYFYLSHTNKELEDKPFSEKVKEIERIYKAEFIDFIRPQVVRVKGEELADQILKEMYKL